jgi:hypothetical protein
LSSIVAGDLDGLDDEFIADRIEGKERSKVTKWMMRMMRMK